MIYNKIEKYILNKLKKNIKTNIYELRKKKQENFSRDVINSIRIEKIKDVSRSNKIKEYIKNYKNKFKKVSKYQDEASLLFNLKLFLKLNLYLKKFNKNFSLYKIIIFIREYPIFKKFNIFRFFIIFLSLSVYIFLEILNHYYYPFNINFININFENLNKIIK